jgi:hypothetical protein
MSRMYPQYPDNETDSAVIQWDATTRIGHVATIWPLSDGDNAETRATNREFLYFAASAYMALEHFNTRNSTVVPELSLQWSDCDFKLSNLVWDSGFNAFQAVKALTTAYEGYANAEVSSLGQLIRPMALLGPALSSETKVVNFVSSSLEIPQITGTATSTGLDSRPMFARTIPTNRGDAAAFMFYLKSIGVYHIGILHTLDEWGVLFNQALLAAADRLGMHVIKTAPYSEREQSLEHAIDELAGSSLRYFIGVLSPDNWKRAVRMAYQGDLMGHDKTWYIAGITDYIADTFELDRETDADIAQALHGTGILLMHVPPQPVFDQAFEDFLLELDGVRDSSNRSMRERFIDVHEEKHVLFDNFVFEPPNPNVYSYLMYDAVMSLGLTACQAPGFFTPVEFYQQLLNIEFVGVSGTVAFDNKTGTRNDESVKYELVNIVLSEERSTQEKSDFIRTRQF